MSLSTALQSLVQRTAGSSGKLSTTSERQAFSLAVKNDLSNIVGQLNTVYKVLVNELVSEVGLDALDKGLVGNVILAHKDATSSSSSVYWNSTKSRPNTLKESTDYIISELSRIENIQTSGSGGSGGGGGGDLATTLGLGNTTSGNDILLTTNDKLTGQTDVILSPAGGSDVEIELSSNGSLNVPDSHFATFGTPQHIVGFSAPFNSFLMGFTKEGMLSGGSKSVAAATTPESIKFSTDARETNSAGTGSDSGAIDISSGNTTSTSNDSGSTGSVRVFSGNANGNTGGGSTGPVSVFTGQSKFSASGDVNIATGAVEATSTGKTGDVIIQTGQQNGSTLRSGDVKLISGNTSSTTPGDIYLTTGSGGGRGAIKLNADHVELTQTDATGTPSSGKAKLFVADTTTSPTQFEKGIYMIDDAGDIRRLDIATEEADAFGTPVLKITPEAPNANLVLMPNGNGSLTANEADDAVTGGTARGIYTVDLQYSRASKTSVASGDYASITGGYNNECNGNYSVISGGQSNSIIVNNSVISGGLNNTCLGSSSTISGGRSNTINAAYAAINGGYTNTVTGTGGSIVGGRDNTSHGDYSSATGRYAITRLHGEHSHAADRISATGDAQYSRLILCGETTSASPTLLYLTGTQRIELEDSSMAQFRIEISAVDSTNGDSAWCTFTGGCKRLSGAASTALIGTTLFSNDSDAGAAGWSAAVSVDTTQGTLDVTVTSSTTNAVYWLATVHLTKIKF